MKFLLFIPLVFFFLQEIPLKENDSFEASFSFQLKPKPGVNLDASASHQNRHTSSDDKLPFVILNLRLIKPAPSETRFRVISNEGRILFTKSTARSSVFEIPLGFADDLKDHVTAHQYDLIFYSASKEPLNKIRVVFEKDGTYSVNGQTRGKL